MKKNIIVIFILISYTGFAQTTDSTGNRKNTILVSYSPFPLVVKQYTVNFEYIFTEQFSISLDIGKADALTDSYSLFPVFLYNSYISRTSLLFIPSSKRNYHWFFGPGVIYRHLWNDNVRHDPGAFGGTCESDVYYQKRKGYSIGAQFTQGWRWFYGPFILYPFYRVGLVTKRININTYAVGGACGYPYYYNTDLNRISIYPSIEVELGVRLGLNYRFRKL